MNAPFLRCGLPLRCGALLATAGLCLAVFVLAGCERKTPRACGPLGQDIYIWQRVWSDAVAQAARDAPAQSGGKIGTLLPLAAEITFRDGQPPSLIRPTLAYAALKTAPACGLALRIAPFAGPFAREDARCHALQALACTLITDARKAGCPVTELQVDFDCAASELGGYRLWVSAIRDALQTLDAPPMLSITVLPSWMSHAGFGPLVREAGHFVLQVHCAELPDPGAPPVICNPARARRWVEEAAAYGVPFRVALPTYTSLVAVNPEGKVVGVSSEGPRPAWPADARVLAARADAPAMAQLVRQWTHDRPAALTGLVWYRLPVGTDRMNWRWPTLNTVMAGRTPRHALRVEIGPGNPADIALANDGEQDEPLPARLRLRWEHAALAAADALAGFAWESAGRSVIFTAQTSETRLAPGERRVIGWIRLDAPAKIYATEN